MSLIVLTGFSNALKTDDEEYLELLQHDFGCATRRELDALLNYVHHIQPNGVKAAIPPYMSFVRAAEELLAIFRKKYGILVPDFGDDEFVEAAEWNFMFERKSRLYDLN